MSSNRNIPNVTNSSDAAALEASLDDSIPVETTGTRTIDTETTQTLCALTGYTVPATANDNDTRRGIADTTRLLAHPSVARYLRATLRRYGVESQDMADAIAEVQTRSLEVARARRMPADLAQWKALAATIAARWAIDRLREAEVRDRYDEGPCHDGDAHSLPTLHSEHRDPVDTKRYLAVLKELFDAGQMPEHGAEILWGDAEQVPHAEIAREIGISEVALRSRLCRMRAKFRAKLAALGMLVVALLILAALMTPPDKVAAPAPHTLPEATPPVRCAPGWDGGTAAPTNSCFPVQRKSAVPD